MKGICESGDGLLWEYLDEAESDFLYHEIVVSDAYLRHGISLPRSNIGDGNDADSCITVIDAGANIGLFSLHAAMIAKKCKTPIKVIAIEPIPKIHEVLVRNLSAITSTITVCAALGSANENGVKSVFTYLPHLPGESSRHPVEATERHQALANVISAYEAAGIEVMKASVTEGKSLTKQLSEDVEDDQSESRKRRKLACENPTSSESTAPPITAAYVAMPDIEEPESVVCIVRSLDSILDEHTDFIGAGSIDLLKIDVEGDELTSLHGISDRWWDRIHQVVIEVYDVEGRLENVSKVLSAKGFTKIITEIQSVEDLDDERSTLDADHYVSFTPKELKMYYVYAMKF